jgi:histidine triad (HIT) family protein
MSENDCVFCQIVRGEIDSEVVHEEEEVLAFQDVGGQAPVHVLVIPKQHIWSLAEIGSVSDGVAKRLFEVAHEVAKKMDVAESGYAFRINNGPDSGQEVFHLHGHVMGGRKLEMP